MFLTGEAMLIGGIGHGSYAPLAFAASVAVFFPLVAFGAGPLLWAAYFLLIPNLQGKKTSLGIWVILLLHIGPGLWLAYDDPAIVNTNSSLLLLFGISFLAATTFLLLLSFRGRHSNY